MSGDSSELIKTKCELINKINKRFGAKCNMS
jgi:hypothetical protein